MQHELKIVLRGKRRKLEHAYRLVKTRVSGIDDPLLYAMTYDTFHRLIKIIYPYKSESKIRVLFKVLDVDGSNVLRKINVSY